MKIKNLLFLNVFSVFFLLKPVIAAEITCQELGYNVDYTDCLNNQGMPLLCPFYNTTKKLSACLFRSCRGYSLTESDLNAQASDGKKVREHIAAFSSCTVGVGEDAVIYYRVDKCNEGSLYQNGVCDVGCSKERYPYDTHQGNLAGDMRDCLDETGAHYGYETCNEGWTGGWKDKKTGICTLSQCLITEYPYYSNPNIEEPRGMTLSCKIGGNTFYKYTAKDKSGNVLQNDTCEKNGYILKESVCSKKCSISNCTSSLKAVNEQELNFSYNEWSCKLDTANCRIGDYVTVNGVTIGVIVHFPEEGDDRMHVMSVSPVSGRFATGDARITLIPLIKNLPGSAMLSDKDGKFNVKATLAFEAQQASSSFTYPLYHNIEAYTIPGCPDVCAAGEWYLYAGLETSYLFNEKYKLYNITGKNDFFLSAAVISSTQYGPSYPQGMMGNFFSGTSGGGTQYYDVSKSDSFVTFPIISFTLKE